MYPDVKWSVDDLDFRIRELEHDDIPGVRVLVNNSLHENVFTAFEALFVKNWRLLIVLSGLTVLLLNYFGYDAQYIVVFLFFQIFLPTIANAVSFYRFFAPGMTTTKKEIVNADKTYVKFWISEVFKDGQWEKVGTAALHEADQLEKREIQTGEIIALKNVSVSCSWRSKRIGAMMVKHALSQATLMKYKTIVVHFSQGQPATLPLYKRNGFEMVNVIKTGCIPLPYGVDVYVMAKKLS
ncbi:uncharacterized protein LOC120329497 isoform X1 [Styela clava]